MAGFSSCLLIIFKCCFLTTWVITGTEILATDASDFAQVNENTLLHFPLGGLNCQQHESCRRRNLQQSSSSSNNNNNSNDHNSIIQIFDEATDHDGLFKGKGTHYVNLYVGCGPTTQIQTVIVDTGSSATAFPCSTCRNGGGADSLPWFFLPRQQQEQLQQQQEQCGEGHHLNPNYDETKSSCFRPLGCNECSSSSSSLYCFSSPSDKCLVSQRYMEGSGWTGYEAYDSVRIGSSNEDPFTLRFACQEEITNLFVTQLADGITGLSKEVPSSLWGQLYQQNVIKRRQFSLCLRHHYEVQDDAGKLVLGGTDVRLHHSNMVFAKETQESDVYWQVRIRKILLARNTVGNSNNMDNNDNLWQELSLVQSDTNDALRPMVDSGSTFTYLHRSLEASIRDAWEEVTPVPFGSRVYSESEVNQLPTIWFVLEGAGGGVQNHSSSIPSFLRNLISDSNDILVAFPPSRYLRFNGLSLNFHDGRSVLGANWMGDHDVFFDMDNHRIGFAESDCTLDADSTLPPSVGDSVVTAKSPSTIATGHRPPLSTGSPMMTTTPSSTTTTTTVSPPSSSPPTGAPAPRLPTMTTTTPPSTTTTTVSPPSSSPPTGATATRLPTKTTARSSAQARPNLQCLSWVLSICLAFTLSFNSPEGRRCPP